MGIESDKSKEELVSRLQKGCDREAQKELYVNHVQPVFRHCRSYGIEATDAEDLVQDIFLTVFTRIESLENPGRFSAWLSTITRNRCFQFLKEQNRRRHREEKLEDSETADPGDGDALILERKLKLVQELIGEVKNDLHRQTIKLFYLDGLTCEEIASQQGMTVTNVTTQLARFRVRIQKELIQKIAEIEP